ncbi:hypothetical protein Btru_001826 [Bulinus truncatus]|nr:hypothetical protein Btru_001826 [Bulinus truncatus]
MWTDGLMYKDYNMDGRTDRHADARSVGRTGGLTENCWTEEGWQYVIDRYPRPYNPSSDLFVRSQCLFPLRHNHPLIDLFTSCVSVKGDDNHGSSDASQNTYSEDDEDDDADGEVSITDHLTNTSVDSEQQAVLSPCVAPFTLPLGPVLYNDGPHPRLRVTTYCTSPGGLAPLPGFLLAEYLAHPEYYRRLRAGFEPKDDGVKDNPRKPRSWTGNNLWDTFYQLLAQKWLSRNLEGQ